MKKTLFASLWLCSLCAVTFALEEKDFPKHMKEVGDIAKRFKASQENKDSAQIIKDTQRLEKIHADMIGFWKSRNSQKAVKWSEESQTAAKQAGAAAKEGNWEGVRAHLQALMSNCKNCHEAHREKLEDGSYRIK